jgi:hypothetical protein
MVERAVLYALNGDKDGAHRMTLRTYAGKRAINSPRKRSTSSALFNQ